MKEKNKKLEKIAAELDGLADKYHDPSLKEIAAQVRKKVSSEQTDQNEKNDQPAKRTHNGGNHPPGGPGKP